MYCFTSCFTTTMSSLHRGYAPINTSEKLHLNALSDEPEAEAHHTTVVDFTWTHLLLSILVISVALTAYVAILLLALNPPLSNLQFCPALSASPPGTLGARWNDTPVAYTSVNSSTAFEVTLNPSISEARHYIGPRVISLLQRTSPFESSGSGASAGTAEDILLTYNDLVLLQFGPIEASLPNCAIAFVWPKSQNSDVVLLGPEASIQVWNVSLRGTLDPAVISYTHRPPRRNYLGNVDLASTAASETGGFRCPTQPFVTVELTCHHWNGCHVLLHQQIAPTYSGLQLAQWEG